MLDAHINNKLGVYSQTDDPFDEVYISDLDPDLISRNSISDLMSLSHIKDLSSEIEFKDGWDD